MTLDSRRRDLLLLVGLCGLCFFWRLGAIGLFDFNEGLYVQAAREMYLRSDLITATVNGVYFFDKPPFALWCAVFSFYLFGVSEFAARFPVALSATLLTFLVYGFGARYFGRLAGLLAAAMVALNPMMFGTARQMTMDIHQSLWFAVALVCFFAAYQSKTPRGKWLSLGLWAGCGLSFMSKSVPGLFPLYVAFVFILIQERFQIRAVWTRIRETKPLPGLLVLAVIISPWHILAYRVHGEIFYQEYWVLHHVALLHGTDFSHAQPFWYYLPALLLGLFPWSLFLPAALWQALRPKTIEDSESSPPEAAVARLFILIWTLSILLLFSAMTSKLISYLLPMYAAAALLVGDWMARAIKAPKERALRFTTLTLSIAAVGLLIAGMVGLHWIASAPGAARAREDLPLELQALIRNILIVVALGFSAVAALIWTGRRLSGVSAMAATMSAFFGLALWQGSASIQSALHTPLHTLAQEAGMKLQTGTPLAVYIGQPRRPSVFFYMPASVFRLIPGEPNRKNYLLETGEAPALIAFLETNRPAYILTDARRAETLLSASPSLVVIESQGKWRLLRSELLPQTLDMREELPR
jgi:4-amino-4-deoxy-L-arabinose transferase-like glycosyltransferase